MISKSLGKVSKLSTIKGASQNGDNYVSAEQMWELELNPDKARLLSEMSGKPIKTIGTKEDWYSGSVQYWNK